MAPGMHPLISARYLTLVILISLGQWAGTSCSNGEMHKNEQLREEIITVHDAAMEKIGYMYQLQVQLQTLDAQNVEYKKNIEEAMDKLKQADTMMFDWMHQYQTLAVDSDLAKDTLYRQQQLQMIANIQQLTNESIHLSEKLLKTEPFAK